jgi:hypothetical protein
VLLALLALPACQQYMARSPAYKPLQPSTFFADGRSSRPLVPGTVARGQLRTDTALYEGHDEKGNSVTEFPFQMTREVLQRGRERFDIFCAVCHGRSGAADGRIVQRGFTRPPAFYDDRTPRERRKNVERRDYSRSRLIRSQGKDRTPLSQMPVGHLFDVATRGFGAMPDHAEQVPVRDRWAIVGYIRVLQQSKGGQQ